MIFGTRIDEEGDCENGLFLLWEEFASYWQTDGWEGTEEINQEVDQLIAQWVAETKGENETWYWASQRSAWPETVNNVRAHTDKFVFTLFGRHPREHYYPTFALALVALRGHKTEALHDAKVKAIQQEDDLRQFEARVRKECPDA